MKSTPTLRFSLKRLFLLTLVSFVAVAALLGIAASANKANRAAKARAAQAANAKAGINPVVQSDKQPLAPTAASVTATLSDNLTPATKVAPGAIINYTAVINNGGASSPTDDATSVQYAATLDPDTTFVPNSAHASPLAINNTYTTVGNTLLEAGVAATGNPAVVSAVKLFDNDTIATSPDAIALASFTATSANGGTVSVNGDGSFTYLPPIGFTGSDTFTYTIRNNNDATLTDTGTVTVTVGAPRVWYVNNSGANGDGRSSSPFNTLTNAAAVDATNDIIYIFTGGGNYTGGITLLNGEQVIGNGAALVVNTFTLRAAGARPTVVNAGGNGLTLATNNTLTGFNFGACTGFAMQGASVGTLAATNMLINNTSGGAMDLTGTAAVNVVMDSTTSTGGTSNVRLVNVNGTVTLGSGALSGSTAGAGNHAFANSGGTAGITFSGSIAKANQGNVVNIASRTAGTVTLSGSINGNGSNGINVSNNTGGTIDFTNGTKTLNTAANAAVTLATNTSTTINFTNGGLDIDTTSGAGFTATGGGTVNVTTGANLNTVDTTTGTGVNIATPTNIGASGVTFRSVTVNNGASNSAANAIILNGTTGAFLVSGDGATTGGFLNRNGTGGTINRTTGHSVLLTNAQNVTLRQMNITNTAVGGGCPASCTADAVHSTTGSDIVLSAVLLQNLGGNGWNAANITGTNAINNNSLVQTWNTATTSGVTVANTTTNFSGTFTVDRTLFSTSATGSDAFLFDVDTAAGGGSVVVTNSEFTLIDQDAVQINHDGSGILNATIQSNNFHDADATGGDGNNTVILVLTSGDRLNFNISNNSFTNLARLSANAGVLQVLAAGGAAGSAAGATLNGTINNNTLTNPAFVSQRRGIMFAAEASAGDHGAHSVAITNNSVQNFFLHGIYCSLASVNGFDVLNTNLTITGNQVGNISPVGQNGGDSGSAMEYETLITADGTGGQLSANLLYQNNTAVSNNSSGIGDTLDISNTSGVTTGAGNSSNLQLTVLGNTLTQLNAAGQVFEARNVLTSTATMCLDLNSGNTSPNNVIGGTGGFRLDNDAGTYNIEGMGASTPSAFLGPRNQSNGASPATITLVAPSTVGSAVSCATPSLPTAVAPAPDTNKTAGNQADLIRSSSTAYAAAATQADVAKVSVPAISVEQIAKAGVASVAAKATPKASAASVNRNEVRSHHAARSNFKGASSQEPNAPTANLPINIGALPAAKSVTIKYQVMVNAPPPKRSVSSFGSFSGIGLAAFSGETNDTDTPAGPPPTDPTVTLVDTTMTWNGVSSVDWNTASNWTQPVGGTQYAPGVSNPAVNDVVIPGGAIPNQPTINASDIGIYSLNIANGRVLTINSPRILTIGGAPGGDLTLDGIISGGELRMGTGAHAINNAGTGSLSSANLLRILSGAAVTLNNDLQAGALAVDGGSITIANRILSLNGPGAALAVAGGATFTTTGSTVVFNGTAAQQAAGTTYNNLTINNTIGTNLTGVTLTGNATVNGALALTSSDLNTDVFTLSQPNTTASTGVSDVIGTITRTAAFGTTPITFGNPNNRITFAAAGTKPTSLTVVLAKVPPATYAAAVKRNYTISQTGTNTSTATLRLRYLDPEVTGFNSEATLNLRRLRNPGDQHWVAQIPGTVDTVNNHVESATVAPTDLPTQWTFSSLEPTAADGIITGRILDQNGNPVEGAVIRLAGAQNRKFITDANGFYRFDNVETTGFYTVTPSRVNFEFSPTVQSFSQIGQTTNAIFSATATGQTANPLDTPEYFVRQHYVDFLGREPDEAGFNFWSDQILGCGGDADCIQRKRENVSAAYFLSIEFRATGGLVDGMYRASYGARPQFGEFMPDARAVGFGVRVNEEGWEAKLQTNKEAFAAAFVNRPAFHARYDGMDASTFVDALISNTGVTFGSSERDGWIAGLTAGNLSRADVVRGIAENGTFVNAKFNDTFVMMQYLGYLRRDPDPDGFQFWLNKLNQFGGNFEQAEMVKAFIISGEYRDRFPR
jgi:hypothetical protein